MAVFVGPGGLVVGLINHDPKNLPEPMGRPLTKCGTFGEFAIAVDDYQTAADFWRMLGYTSLHESVDPYPWGILSDEKMVLGLHQTDQYGGEVDFSGPAMTYFAPDMARRLEELKEAGYVFASEMVGEEGQVSNATLKGPDGELLFLFQGEI